MNQAPGHGWFRRNSLILVAAVGGAAGVAYATQRGSQGLPVATPDQDKTPKVFDTVQVALLLDTSSSMDGLINQARSHLWTMVDKLGAMQRTVKGELRGVKLELALYEYGNNTVAAAQGHIRQVTPFSSDLDHVAEQLHRLSTNGGSEFAGLAIDRAVTDLAWSTDADALKFVFVAGNETFTQGPVSAEIAMARAAEKNVHVQLIHCGGPEPTWASAAKLAKSDLLTIDQNQVAQYVAAPQDEEILAMSTALNRTYIGYGAAAPAASARQAAADASSVRLSKKVALERAAVKTKKGYNNAAWDLVDAQAEDPKALGQLKEADLPSELRGKSKDEQRALLDSKAAERKAIKQKMSELEAQRQQHLKAQAATEGAAGNTLDTEMLKSVSEAASAMGYQL